MLLEGTFTALITPFIEDQIDLDGLRLLIRRQIEAGVAGVVLLGSTGENPTVSDEERREMIEIGVQEAKGKIKLLVDTASNSTAVAIKKTLSAKALGADGALVITPYYNRPTQQGIYEHFKTLAEKTEFPILVYNHPGRSGVNIETSTLCKIAENPYIAGVKDSSGNALQFADVIAEIRARYPQFCVLSGDDALALPLIALGGQGLVSVVGNLLPHEVDQLVQTALRGDFKQARFYHEQLLPLFRLSCIETNPMPIKEMMRLAGLPAGFCRLPLCSLKEENQKKIQNLLLSSNYS